MRKSDFSIVSKAILAGVFLISSTLGCTSLTTKNPTPIGMLKTRDYIVTMYVGSNATLYSVRTLDGILLEEDLQVDSMIAQFPSLEFYSEENFIDYAGSDIQLNGDQQSTHGLINRDKSYSRIDK